RAVTPPISPAAPVIRAMRPAALFMAGYPTRDTVGLPRSNSGLRQKAGPASPGACPFRARQGHHLGSMLPFRLGYPLPVRRKPEIIHDRVGANIARGSIQPSALAGGGGSAKVE